MKRYSQRRGSIPDRPNWDIRKIKQRQQEVDAEKLDLAYITIIGIMLLPFFIRFFGG